MAEEIAGFTLPPEESTWSNIDWKPLLIGTAFSLSPELRHMAPLFMKAFQEGSQNAQAKRFAQGLMGAQKLAAEGNMEGAQAAMQALAQITPPGMLQHLNKAATAFGEQQKQANFTKELLKLRPDLAGSEKVLQGVSAEEQFKLATTPPISHEGTVAPFNRLTQQLGSPQFLAQRPEAPGGQEFAAQAARMGFTPADITNALNSGNPEQVGAALNVMKGTQTAADEQTLKQFGQKEGIKQQYDLSTATGKAQIELSTETAKTPILADRAKKVEYAQVEGKTEAEKFMFLANPLQEKASNYIDVETLQPATPDLTGQQLVQSQRFRPMTPVQQEKLQEKVTAAESYTQAIGEMRTVMAKYPDLFPEKGSLSKNAVKQFELWAKGKVGELDPRYTEAFAALDALKAGSARYAKAWGDTGNINEQEQLRQIEAMGLKPGLREGTKARLDQLERLMTNPVNNYMERSGFKFRLKGASRPLTMQQFNEMLQKSQSGQGNPQ